MSIPSNAIPTSILQLPEDPSPSDLGWMVYVNNGVTYKVQVNAVLNVSGVPTTRTVTAGAGLTGGGALSANITITVANGGIGASQLNNTGVTAGVYGDSSNVPVLTVDANGRVTAATTLPIPSIAGYVPTSRQVIAGTGLSGGGPLTSNVTLTANLSSATPLSVGSATAGVSTDMSRSDHVHSAINLSDTSQTTNALDITRGGTGTALTAPPNGGIVYSDGSQLQVSSAGSNGQVLVSSGAGAPGWGAALVLSNQPANYFYAGPSSGAPAPTAFRAIVNDDLPASGVTANTYGSASSVPVFTVNSKGVLSSAVTTTIAIGNSNLQYSSITINGSAISLGGSATVTATATNALTIGTGLSGTSYNGSTAVTVAISNTGVTAASVGSASKTLTATVNAQGQLTSLADTNIAISNTQVSGLGSAALLAAGAPNGVATLDGGGTVPTSQLPAAVLGALKYQGTWNATTNVPTLASSVGVQGYYYVVATAGSTNLDGITDWKVGDWVIFGTATWQKIDNTETVTSVNGYIGTVVLTAADVGAVPYAGATGAVDLNNRSLTNVSYLGINTATVPTILFRAFGDNNSSSRVAVRGYSSDASSSSMRVTKFRGSYAAPQPPQSGDSLGKFELAGYGTTSSDGYAQASFEGVATQAWGSTARGTKTLIKVTPNATTTQVIAVTVDQDKTATFAGDVSVTGHTTFEGVTSTGATGTGNIVYSASPTFTGTLTCATLVATTGISGGTF